MFKLDRQHRPNPLESISDLIEFLNKSLKLDYMIAGGFPRDWYSSTLFNDIDIYLDIQNTYIKDTKTLAKILKASQRFEIVRDIEGRFIEAIFCEKSPFSKGHPKYRVQFIMGKDTYSEVLTGFDFEHCKFFIPVINQDPKSSFFANARVISGEVYGYNSSISALTSKQLIFSDHTIERLKLTKGFIPFMETRVKRILKFTSRGFIATPQVKEALTESIEKFLIENTISRIPAGKSILFNEAVDYDEAIRSDDSIYKESEVVKNLIKHILMIYTPAERANFLVSPCPYLRDAVHALFQEFPELRDNGV